jgi:hypothetical protein
MINYNEIDLSSIQVDGLNTNDYPDFVDAFIAYAEYRGGIELEPDELDLINDDSEFVYECVIRSLGY